MAAATAPRARPALATKIGSAKPSAAKKAAGGASVKEPAAAKLPRAKTAFNFFQAARNDAVKKANPDLSMGERTKAISQEWNSLEEESRREYKVGTARLLFVVCSRSAKFVQRYRLFVPRL